MQRADVVIVGAGVVGLFLALRLRGEGFAVLVLERRTAGAGASRAAAGMLAARDPGNPPELAVFAGMSARLYPRYLEMIRSITGEGIPFETEWTLEPSRSGERGHAMLASLGPEAGCFDRIAERSLDPRRLIGGLEKAVRETGVTVVEGAEVLSVRCDQHGAELGLSSGETIACGHYVDCGGAWSKAGVVPAKGQMLRVRMPEGLMRAGELGNMVVRTPEVYVVPRLDGTAIIGATVEDAGFSETVEPDAIAGLRAKAARLMPALAETLEVERWAGLRPRTRDDLPMIGRWSGCGFVANGMFRNGILLAPIIAELMTEMLRGGTITMPMEAFDPLRFSGVR